MKHLFIVTFVFICSFCSAQPKEGVDTNFHLYLLAGQSNMAGRGPLDSLCKETNPQIWMFDKKNKWVPAKDPVHFDKPESAGVGPAIAFAKEMIKDNKNIRIGLIPCAWGGSSIKVWQPDSSYINHSHPYDDAIGRTKEAMKYGVLKAILWHQGESDNNQQAVANYMDRITVLINGFRTEFNSPNLTFIAGEIGRFGKGVPPVNNVIDEIPNRIPFTSTVSSDGLKDKGDKLHFDAASARELGKRYATALKKMIKETK